VDRHVFLLAATHDLELLPLLADRTRAFHFGDAVTKHGLEFDYCLQPGPSSSRNAIAFLEFLGAPSSVVEEASAFARRTSPPVV
jgi:DNA mismatch repair ATPase MutS